MDITVTKKGCKLTFKFNPSDDTYGFLVNTITEEFSDIEKFNSIASFEVDADGIYEFILIESKGLTIPENKLVEDENGNLVPGFKIYNHSWPFIKYYHSIHTEELGGSTIHDTGNFSTKKVFSTCKLEKCLLSLQLKVFNELVKNCGKSCKNLDETKSQRDFLFIANWIMQHLEEYDRFEELYNIYEGIQSCNSLCSDLLKNNKCGCNG